MKEEWKDIFNIPNLYQISNFGRIKFYPRLNGNGIGYLTKEKISFGNDDQDGYKKVCLTFNNKAITFGISKLVIIHFSDPIFKPGFHICHKDGNKHNNRIDNLYIGDAISNSLDKYSHGRTKLTPDEIKEIRLSSESQYFLANKFGVKQPYISRIKNYKRATTIL